MYNYNDLIGKKVLVTGASGDIGLALWKFSSKMYGLCTV
ncbi:short-chain dehydrogenase/reductase SDR (plasmid) [Klebsiella aerogenes]|nr:short-chain dehydrogenase/reductase SDR [Klebsiella aerogenes]